MNKQFWFIYLMGLTIFFMILFCAGKCQAQTVPLVRASHDSFVSYYDIETHCPALVVYLLEHRHFSGSAKVKGRHFKMDVQLPKPRVKDSDYSGSGYVRGHLCSAGDRDSDKAWLKETYLTSNLVPMTLVCNSGAWKVIEDSCRKVASAGHRLIICRGSLFNSRSGEAANVSQLQRVISTNVIQNVVPAERNRPSISIPVAFFCFAKCLDCRYRYVARASNTNSTWLNCQEPCNTSFTRDERISVLLQNILGSWSREEYETITR